VFRLLESSQLGVFIIVSACFLSVYECHKSLFEGGGGPMLERGGV